METALAREIRRLLSHSGRLAMRHFGQVPSEHKSDGSLVTTCDREVESWLVDELSRTFPEDGIVGEEGARIEPRSGGATWHIDPIDGTSGFLGGLAYWGPTICRVRDGELEVGGFYVPRVDELWYAEKGGGAWLNGTRLRSDPEEPLHRHSILFVPSRFHLAGEVPWPGKMRGLGSGAAHLALVAAGHGALVVMPRWELWDIGCGVLLVREAGRMIRDPSGAPIVPEAGPAGAPFLAGTRAAVERLTADGWAASVLRRRRRDT